MGDMSEYRGLIVIGSTISIAVMLMALIPAGFYPSYNSTRQISVPEYFELIDLTNYIDVWNSSMDDGDLINWWYTQLIDDGDGDFGGWEFDFESNYEIREAVRISQKEYFLFFLRQTRFIADWTSHAGIPLGDELSKTELLDNGLEYTVSTPDTGFDVLFSYNQTLYSDVIDAWDNDAVYVLCGIHFDQAQTGYNAWDIIAQVLFFQMPDVHWFINALLAVPFWLGVAYIAFILALRAIGAVFGGGA